MTVVSCVTRHLKGIFASIRNCFISCLPQTIWLCSSAPENLRQLFKSQKSLFLCGF